MADPEAAAPDTGGPEGVWATTAEDEIPKAESSVNQTPSQEQPSTTIPNGGSFRPPNMVPPPNRPQGPPVFFASAMPTVNGFAPPKANPPMQAANTYVHPPPQTSMGPGGTIWTPTCVLTPRAPNPSTFTKLANGGYAPDVTARELLHGPLERIPPQRLEDLRWHLRQLISAEAATPSTPMTAIYVPPEKRGIVAESDVSESSEHTERRGTKRSAEDMLISPAWREGACAAADLMAKRKLAKANPGDKVELYLRQLNYSQDSIKGTFQDGRLVGQMTKELQVREKGIEDIPTVMALVHQNQIYSVDNRRLWSFKNSGLSPDAKIPVVAARANHAFYTKFTTPSSGKTVRKRS